MLSTAVVGDFQIKPGGQPPALTWRSRYNLEALAVGLI